MRFQTIWAVYFSATGTTKKTAVTIADALAEELGGARRDFDFTLPGAREKPLSFSQSELVVFATPVYAGRVPNVLLKYLASIEGGGAAAVPVSLYGNRDFDDALLELKDILEADGFVPAAAAAFVGEHSFSKTLAGGRPDARDLDLARSFARDAAKKLAAAPDAGALSPIAVSGVARPYRGYYQPRDRNGSPVDIRKVKPRTGESCDRCMLCAELCPMGSISREDVREFTGICIKCCACVKHCPQGARYFDDAAYLYHKRELEEGLTRRAQPALFL